MSERRLHPAYRQRLDLEAEAISVALCDFIDKFHQDLSNHAATWQPAPCPSEWGVHQPRKRNQS